VTARLPVVVVGVDAGHDDCTSCEHDALELAARLENVTFVSVHVVS